MKEQTFLVEIGTEELPPKTLYLLAESFAQILQQEFTNAHLSHGKISWFATPRRLAVQVEKFSSKQQDSEVEKRGPALAQAYDKNGQPTQAALGWARGCGIDLNQAEHQITDKGEWLFYRAHIKGKSAIELLPALVENALKKLPIAKPMRWGAKDIYFIRPIHSITLLFGEQLVPGTILGIQIDRKILGHRFMGESLLTLEHAKHYAELLEKKGKVIADYQVRYDFIKQGIEKAATKLNGQADLDPNLLHEVTSLVEWPIILTAKFEPHFLNVPAEALVYTMKGDQKYFPVYDNNGKLLPNFIFVTNIESNDPQQIITGNQKVIRPRLADAEFFFKSDCKQRLIDQLPRLKQVLFQQQLGSLYDKTTRLEALAAWIAKQIAADVKLAKRAALLAKCDLMTNMVNEFTETQGIMGMYYAKLDGEAEEVALAINEQYKPRFAGDSLPTSNIACTLAIADKIDTLVGIIGINQHPKGDKDPFALRRNALGVLKIMVDKKLSLDLATLIPVSIGLYSNKLSNTNTYQDVLDFMLNRFHHWYQEQNYTADTIQAVLARRPTCPLDFDSRVKAVTHFRTLPEANTLAAANKRVSNILAKKQTSLLTEVDSLLLQEPAEIELASSITKLQNKLEPLFSAGNYTQALIELTTLHDAVDKFFNNVMVMAEQKDLRINRLSLLNQLRNLFLRIADISLLQIN